ncbi:hypothetical protein C1Z69_09095 [Campylobacter jejuni]|nr:hypothetical protein [Campylobacter jejuni]
MLILELVPSREVKFIAEPLLWFEVDSIVPLLIKFSIVDPSNFTPSFPEIRPVLVKFFIEVFS